MNRDREAIYSIINDILGNPDKTGVYPTSADIQELRLKALRVIEGLCFPDVSMPSEEKLNEIYKFAHIAVGDCRNKHAEWHDDLDWAERALIKAGIM